MENTKCQVEPSQSPAVATVSASSSTSTLEVPHAEMIRDRFDIIFAAETGKPLPLKRRTTAAQVKSKKQRLLDDDTIKLGKQISAGEIRDLGARLDKHSKELLEEHEKKEANKHAQDRETGEQRQAKVPQAAEECYSRKPIVDVKAQENPTEVFEQQEGVEPKVAEPREVEEQPAEVDAQTQVGTLEVAEAPATVKQYQEDVAQEVDQILVKKPEGNEQGKEESLDVNKHRPDGEPTAVVTKGGGAPGLDVVKVEVEKLVGDMEAQEYPFDELSAVLVSKDDRDLSM